MRRGSTVIGLAVLTLISAGCGRDAPEAPVTHVVRNANPLGRSAFLSDPDRPSPAALTLARQMDEIQRLMDDDLYETARVRLKALLEGGCQHPEAFLLQARLLYQQSRFEEAIPWCDRAIAASGFWLEPRVLLAQSYLRLKRLGAAESVFADLDRLAAKAPWGPYGEGVVALMRGDRERAVAFLDEALRRDPDHLATLRVRIDLAAQARQTGLQERLLARYLARDPNAGWAHALLGDLATAAGHLEEARRSYQRAYECEPTPTTARHLADLAQRRGDETDAVLWRTKAGISAKEGPAARP